MHKQLGQVLFGCLLLLGCLHIFAQPVSAAQPLLLEQGKINYPLGLHLEYLEDAERKLSFEDVTSAALRKQFKPNQQAIPNLGYIRSSYWYRLQIRNVSAQEENWFLENQYPLLDIIDLYVLDKRGLRTRQHSGDSLPFHERGMKHRSFVFKIDLKQDEEITAYIHVQSEGSIQMPMVLWSEKGFLAKDHEEQYMFGIYYGILLAMLLYNLLIYLSIRDINYLYYVWYITGWGILQMALNGLAFEYLWPDYPWWGNVAIPFFIGLAMSGVVQFSRSFLQLKKNYPRFDLFFKFLLVAFILIMLGAFTLPYSPAIRIAAAFAIIATLSIFIAGSVCLLQGAKEARYFMLAWTVLLLGTAAYAMKAFALVPNFFITEYSMQIGSAFEVIFLSFALAHRMKLLIEENQRMQQEATETLEKHVQERTLQLKEALTKLSDANDKLKDLSVVDGLTGVKNRKFFDEKYLLECKLAYRGKLPLALLLLDIDHFKKINDTYGHLVGDEALKQVAAVIRNNLKRPADQLARYGGEEFGIILPHTDRDGALHLAEQIRHGIETSQLSCDGKTLSLTASIGVAAIVPQDMNNPEEIIANADSALYEAKDSGRNQVKAYTGQPANKSN